MSPQRLNAADQFTLMMDHEIRASGLAGNFCALIFELDGIPDAFELKQKCALFHQRFPISSARIRRRGRQFEWYEGGNNTIPFYEHTNTELTSNLVEEILNESKALTESVPLEFHLVAQKTKSLFILRWFHPICDAKGAELIIYHLFRNSQDDIENCESVIDQLSKRLSLWGKIKFGFKSKKNIQNLDNLSSILPLTSASKPNHVKIKTLDFTESQSQQILKLARQSAGLSGTSLYFIGCMMRALELSGNVDVGEAYCVPYAVNLRKRKSLFPVFGNQVSFLFAQASKDIVQDRNMLFVHLREQNKKAVKQNLDRAMIPLMQAGSWLGLEKYGKIVRCSPSGKERSSFWFSYTGSMDPEPQHIDKCPITKMYQSSLVTTPPSLGLLVNHFQNRIILSFNYIDNQFDSSSIDDMLENMKSELLEIN